MKVRFTILGPVEVSVDGRPLPGTAPRHRAVLGYLLLHAGTPVSADRLIDAIWGPTPPDTARSQIQAAVAAIRRVLREAGGAEVLATRAAGYVITPQPGQFDLADFTTRMAAVSGGAMSGAAISRGAVSGGVAAGGGRAVPDGTAMSGGAASGGGAANGDAAGAVRQIRAALGLWRGRPFADVHGDYVPGARARLDERRLAAFERLADLQLSLGGHDDLLDELAGLVAEHPLREPLARRLMLALHRAGRQADALLVARTLRADLAEQQGLDPGRAFIALEQAILTDAPGLHTPDTRTSALPAPGLPASGPHSAALPPAGHPASGPYGSGPRHAGPPVSAPPARCFLPYDTPDFAGRGDELDRLGRVRDGGGVVTISAIDGMAGIGKTALAIRAGHRLAGHYPDGQLFIDLQAHTAGRPPITADAALEVLLRQLGLPTERIPASATDRAALWRAELADRRILAVLDNAADVAQVRPLLPGPSGSLILITSRRRLTDLDGAQALSMDLLPTADAVGLFTAIVGERAAAEPAAVLDVLHLCGFLPLAVRIAAARLHHRPQWTVAYLAGRLRDQRRRLTELSTSERSVAAAFTMSYQQLDPDRQRMFGLCGLHPGRDIDARAAAALAGVSVQEAEPALEDLLDAHVLAQHEPGRYTFHDLLREHARATVMAEEPAAARHEALTRLFDHYLRAASAATDLVYAHRPAPDRFEDAAEALEWLDAERANLVAIATFAADREWASHTGRLATALYRYLDDNAHHSAAVDLYTKAVQAGRRGADKGAEVRALLDLEVMNCRQGRFGRAYENATRALAVAREIGDRHSEARALCSLGDVSWRRREYDQARDHYLRTMELYREAADRRGEAIVLGNLGLVAGRQGHYEQARDQLGLALRLHRELGIRGGQGTVLGNLGLVCQWQGRYDEAREHHRGALALFRQIGYRTGEADALNALAETTRAETTRAEAGEAADHEASLTRAAADHEAALAIALEIGNRPEQARAHGGLAHIRHAQGRPVLARDHAEQALGVYTDLELPEADDTRTLLAALPVSTG